MRKFTAGALALALSAYGVYAAELNGAKIKLTTGEHISKGAPVRIAFDGEAPEGVISVQDEGGRAYPATLRNGELTFVLERALANTESVLTVQVDSAGIEPKVMVQKQGNGDAVDVMINGELFTSYVYSNDNKKPFLYPVLSEDGVPVTRDFPMKTEDIPKIGQDHPHHKSLWTAYGDVNGADCWDEGGHSGFQQSDDVTWGSGNAYGWIHAKNTWQDNARKALLTEEREYRFYATPADARVMDVRVTFTADKGEVKFGDTKEGGIVSVRMRPELSYANGEITNALGDKGEGKCWGKPSPWCDYSGELPGIGFRGITVMDNPANFRYPTSWHVRGYGLMGANCFGYSYFKEKPYNKDLVPDNGDHTLKEGENLTFNYRVLVHSDDVVRARISDRFADYATPPKAEWVH